ncbi:MAG: hypothetical protein ABSB83_01280 [Methanomassiliicoccales archaeon]
MCGELRRSRSIDGVGGFSDSFLVMIIVTLGIMLVTRAVSVTRGGLSKNNRGGELPNEANHDLLDQVLSNKDLFIKDGLVDFTLVSQTFQPMSPR